MSAPRGSFAFGKKRARVGRAPLQMKRARTGLVPAWGSRGPSAAAVGRAVAAGQELKFHDLDIDVATTAITTAGVIAEDSCVTIAQDTTESTRIGRKCTIRSIGWRFKVTLPGVSNTGASGGDTVRLLVYLDKQANKAAATVTGILESANYQSFNQLANKGRFRTLMDRTYTLNNLASAGDGSANDHSPVSINDTWFKDCSITIEYDNSATTGALGTVTSNNIGVLAISSAAVVSLDSKMRLRFSDS